METSSLTERQTTGAAPTAAPFRAFRAIALSVQHACPAESKRYRSRRQCWFLPYDYLEAGDARPLAGEARLSRTTLARRFTGAVGEPPLGYLTRWRMHLAAARLKDTSDTVEVIAREVGYTSEHAFNRAFARHRGHPPGRYRRLARAA